MKLPDWQKLLSEALGGHELLEKSHFAGGCVRDHLMNAQNQPADIDIAVCAPQGGEKLAWLIHQRLGGSEPVVYKSFGTASLVLNGVRLEFVQTRRESYRERNRKPEVSFGSLEDDALRRDFGINALYMSILDARILDPSGRGMADLEARIIRCVDDFGRVFREDPLRLLRAIRFSVRFGFEIEENTWQAMLADASWIQSISDERIGAEFNSMLSHPDGDRAVLAIRLLHQSGILGYILPEVQTLSGLEQNKYHHLDVFDHTLEVVRNSPCGLVSRWAAILHDIGKPATAAFKADGSRSFYKHEHVSAKLAEPILLRFGVPRPQRKLISHIIAGHMRFKNAGADGSQMKDATLLRIADQYGAGLWPLLDLAHADNLSHAPQYCNPMQIPGLRQRFESLHSVLPKFSLTGKDLITYFDIPPSPELGSLLQKAKEVWYEHPDLGKDELLSYLSQFIKKREK